MNHKHTPTFGFTVAGICAFVLVGWLACHYWQGFLCACVSLLLTATVRDFWKAWRTRHLPDPPPSEFDDYTGPM